MGLKYTMFMMKSSSNDLFKKLIEIGCIDDTKLYLKSRDFDNKINKELKDLKNKKISKEEKSNIWMELINKETEDKELLKFKRRSIEKEIKEFEIWWKTLDENYIFGSFTSMRIWNYKFKIFVSGIFTKADLKEWIIVDYHHGSNEGSVMLLKNEDKINPVNFDIKENEKEKWEKYAKRVSSEINYPVLQMHNHIYKSGYDPIDWEYLVSYKLKEVKKKESKMKNTNISLCSNCYCITKSIKKRGKLICGKCGYKKSK